MPRCLSLARAALAWQEPEFKELPLSVDAAADRRNQTNPARRRSRGPHRQAGGSALRGHRAGRRRVLESRQPPRHRRAPGRRGATRLQHLRLGQGTSQHVLIAGKTGSGKSTLLHALITNAALRVQSRRNGTVPDRLQERRRVQNLRYARAAHARVIAIESEREFGLSVMQRLDAEMRLRGERFREMGVQDIAGYRDAGQALPRDLVHRRRVSGILRRG